MTDETMDARLRAAGERWRAGTTVVAEPPAATGPIELAPPPHRPRRTRWIAAASAAVVAAALAVGGTLLLTRTHGTGGQPVGLPSTHPAASLVDTDWQLVRIIDRDGNTPALDRASSLRIGQDGRLVASDGLNTLGAEVTIHRTTLELRDVGTTLVGSTQSSVVTDTVDAMLSDTVAYTLKGDQLILGKPGVGMLVYNTASSLSTPQDLTKYSWRLIAKEVTTTSGGSSSGSGSSAVGESVLSFVRTGFELRHRCYTNQGSARLGAGTMTLSHVTLKQAIPCPTNGTAAAEQKENGFVDDLLTGRVTWSIAGTALTITKGGRTATFRQAG